jgi:hypothetical protein
VVLSLLLLAFPLLAQAQEAPPVDLGSLSSIATLLLWAVEHHAWRYVVGVSLIAATALVRWAVPRLHDGLGEVLRSDRGGAALVLLLGLTASATTALLAPVFSPQTLLDGLWVAFTAAGGFTVMKRLLAPKDKKWPEVTLAQTVGR